MEVLFHRLAAKEYLAARRWYARRSPATAVRFRDAVDEAIARITAEPSLGTPFRDRFRWVRVRRYPFLLYYAVITGDEVMVFAVAHSRRRPGYWLRRATS